MATNGHSGYPLKWFKDQNAARHAYECAICMEVLKDPVQVRDCGHQFCALCMDEILQTDPRCPSCRIELSNTMIFEDHAARRLIKQLNVNCCNEGCNWQGCLSSLLEDHQNSCNFLIQIGDDINQLGVKKLEKKIETLMLKVSTLEKKHEQDIKELKLKYDYELRQVKFENENKLREVKSKHDEDIRVLRQEMSMSQTTGAAHASHALHQSSLYQPTEPTFTMKIANFTRKLARAKSDNVDGCIESEPFFSSHGYRMQLEVYLNEAPSGFTGYMGVYLRLLKSNNDGRLAWPFTNEYTFILEDQQDDLSQAEDIEDTVYPEGEAEFERPGGQHKNSGHGFPDFVKHSTPRTRQYVRNHTVYIKVVVHP